MQTNAAIEPVSRTYTSQGLKLHYLDWGNESAPLLLLVHGMLESAKRRYGFKGWGLEAGGYAGGYAERVIPMVKRETA